MKKNFLTLSLFCFVIFCTTAFSACKNFSIESLPYLAAGEFVMEADSENYSVCGLNFQFYNQSVKQVKEISVAFFLFDKDGEPARECSNRINLEIESRIEAGDSLKKCISLDRFMNQFPEETLYVDYLYVSRIEYEDGSLWEDPFGLTAFK